MIFSIAFISGCGKDEPAVPIDSIPLVTAVGIPTDLAVTTSIDADGGTFSSADGLLEITVPAGSVNAATSFSIQPIVNNCPGGLGQGYRLLPENVAFAQPILLNFIYPAELIANEKFLAIAFQGTDHTWFAPKLISLNTSGNIISVSTRHFSDWVLFQKISISPAKSSVKVKKALDLQVVFVGDAKSVINNLGDELTNLNIAKTYASVWHASAGTVVKQDENRATFTAPASVPTSNPVAVTATLSNVRFNVYGVTFSNPQVIAHITITDEELLFLVEFNSNRPMQALDSGWFTETDKGSMIVSVKGDTVEVYGIINENAEVTPSSLPEDDCTWSISSPGDGPYHVSGDVVFDGIYTPDDNQVLIYISSLNYSKGLMVAFLIVCPMDSQIFGGEEIATFPFDFAFDASLDYQETILTIPAIPGIFPEGFFKTAVTKI